MAEPKYFKTIYVLSDIWQSAGYGSIVYMAALTGIDPSLYEAATVDGASKWDKLIHITLPGDYSFSAAVGLFNSVINFTIIMLFNKFSKKISEVSLW